MDLQDKVAIVTGGDSGIGRAIALELAAGGARVTINYHSNAEAAAEVEQQITSNGGQALVLQGNVAEPAAIQQLIDKTVEQFGRLDIMINNAGIENRTSLLDTSEKDFDMVVGVNLKGAFFGTQRAAAQFVAQGGGGRIVNISSVHEDWPMPGNITYCCAKGGLRMLTRTAGVELGPHGILVVNVGPGAVATPINKGTLADPDQKAKLDGTIPVGYVAQPEAIARLVCWLASDANTYVTATTYFVDGGIMQNSVGL